MQLTDQQKKALRGELSEAEYADQGMGLFQAGLCSLDPLVNGARSFQLTQKGRETALALRAEASTA